MSNLKKQIPEISESATKFFDLISNGMNIDHCDDYDLLLKKLDLTDESLLQFLNDTKYSEKTFSNYQQWMIANGKTTSTFANFTKKAGTALKTFAATLGSMAVMWAISTVINEVIEIIDSLILTVKEASDVADSFTQSLSNFQSEANNNLRTISTLSNRYEELSKKVDKFGGKIGLTSSEYDEYLDICNQVSSIMPELISYYDEEGNAIIQLTGEVDNLTEAYRRKMQMQAESLLTNDEIKAVAENYQNYFSNGSNDFSNLFSSFGTYGLNLAQTYLTNQGARHLFDIDTYEELYGKDTVRQWLKDWSKMTSEEFRNFVGSEATQDMKRYLNKMLFDLGYEDGIINTDNFNQLHDSILRQLDNLEGDLSKRTSEIQTVLNQMFMVSGDYSEIESSKIKDGIKRFINSIDEEFIKKNNLSEVVNQRSFVNDFLDVLIANQDEITNTFSQFTTDMSLDAMHQTLKQLESKFGYDSNLLAAFFGLKYSDELYDKYQDFISTAARYASDERGGVDREKYTQVYSDLQTFLNENSINTQDELNKFQEIWIQSGYNLEKAMSDYFAVIENEKKNFSLSSYKDQIDSFQSTISSLGNALAKLYDGSITDSELVDFAQEFINLDIESKTLEQDIRDLIDNTLNDLLSSMDNPPQGLVDLLRSIAEEAKDAADGIKELSNALSDVESAHDLLKNVKTDMQVGRINISNLQAIIKMYPQLENAVAQYNYGLISSTELYDELEKCYQEDYIALKKANELKLSDSSDYYYSTLETESNKVDEFKRAYGIDLKNYSSLAQAKLDIEKKLKDELTSLWKNSSGIKDVYGYEVNPIDWEQFFNVKQNDDGIWEFESTGVAEFIDNRLGSIIGKIGEFPESDYTERYITLIHAVTDYVSELNNQTSSLGEIFASFDDFIIEFGGEEFGSEKDIEYLDWYKVKIDRLTDSIEDYNSVVNDGNKSTKEREEALKEQICLTEDLKETNQAAASTYLDKAQNIFNDSGLDFEYWNDIIHGELRLEDFNPNNESDANKLEILEEVLDWYEQYIDATNDAEDAEKDLAELRKKTPEDLFQSYDWLEKKLDKIKKDYEELDKISNDEFVSFDDIEQASRDKITNTLESYIPDIDKVIEKYEEELNKIDISDEYKTKIQNGAFEIETGITNEEIEKIEEYTEAWNKLQNAIQTKEDLNSLPEQYQELFEKIEEKYNSDIDEINHNIDDFNNNLTKSDFDNTINKSDILSLLSDESVKLAETSYDAANALESIVNEMLEMGITANSPGIKGLIAIIENLRANGAVAEQEAMDYDTQRFDELVSQYEKTIVDNENRKNSIETELAKAEAQGYINTANYYNRLIENQLANQKTNNEKLAALQEELTNLEAEYPNFENSDVWHEKKLEIDEVTLALEEGELQLIEYANAIRQIKWDVFDFLQEQIETVSDEASFLIDLFSNMKQFDDKGQLTDIGWATMGNHAVIYETSLAKAKKYADEIEQIERELAEYPYDTERINRKNELIGLYQDETIAAENAKQAMIDMVEEGINLELESLQSLIDEYKEALQAQKDLYDWQKKSANQSKTIAQLQKQLAAYENDKSEESKKKIQQIRVQLQEAQSDMDDMQYDNYISEQDELLSSLYSEYESVLNERMDNVDVLFNELMDDVNQNSSAIANTIKTEADKWGYDLQTELQDIWGIGSDINTSIGNTAGNISSAVSGALGKIDTDISNMESNLNTKLDTEFGKLDATLGKEFSDKTDSELLKGIHDNVESYVQLVTGTDGHWFRLVETVQLIATYLMNWDANGIGTQGNVLPNNNGNVEPTPVIPSTSGKDSEEKSTPQIGEVFYGATGRWYESSDGTGDIGHVDTAGATSWKLDKINEGAKYPYHLIGYDNGKFAGSGWVEKLPEYSTGLYKSHKDQLAWTQDGGQEAIIRKKDGAILTRVNPNDMILNSKATNNLWDAMNDPSRFIQNYMPNVNMPTSIPLPSRNVANNVENHFDKVEFVLPNVKNYNEFMTEMQHDRKFEKMIQDMSINRLAGGSSVDKYRYRW